MLLQVLHETRYDYSAPVENAQHVAHLKPLAHAGQALLSHRLHISPQPAQLRTVNDVYGNSRTYFSLHSSHDRLVVLAESVVRTEALPTPDLKQTVAWEKLRQHCQYQAGAPWDAAIEFAFGSPWAPRDEAFAQWARPSFSAGRPVGQAAWDLMQRIHRQMRYESLSTEVNTPALQALRQGKGVCQDFAHILVACCRSLGLPARYVSGYVLTMPPPGQSRLIGCDASHAWAQVYCLPAGADGQVDAGRPGFWLDLDPTNDRLPGPDYVSVATGRDFLDVSPLRGVIQGGSSHRLSVAVTVAPLDCTLSAASLQTAVPLGAHADDKGTEP
jgi:transglutaminase-like putative cysteine protease